MRERLKQIAAFWTPLVCIVAFVAALWIAPKLLAKDVEQLRSEVEALKGEQRTLQGWMRSVDGRLGEISGILKAHFPPKR